MRIAAELHCHTWHSDAKFQPSELAESARDLQLDIIALTDHNTMSGYRDLEETGFPFIRGIEWTTFFGHMVVLGQERYVDWRDATIENIDEKIAQIHTAHGLAGIAHPFSPGSPMCTGCYWDFNIHEWDQVDYLEVWNGSEFPPLAPHNLRAKKLWLSLLDQGYRITPTYGRDWHSESYSPEPRACTWLEVENADERNALDAISNGRTLLSIGPDLIWAIENGDSHYSAGDSVPEGTYLFRAEADMVHRSSVWKQFDIHIDKIILFGKNEKQIASIPGSSGSVMCDLTGESFIRVEALGSACGKKCTVCLSAPAYIV